MQKDIRDTPLYRESEALFRSLRQPGTGQVSDPAEIHAAPDGAHAVFTGILMDKLEGAATTRICQVDLTRGSTQVLTFGPNTDRMPRYSPDGRSIAFLSDRHQAGDFQLYLLDRASGAARTTPRVSGWVEYLQWSSDGRRILLGVAGHGADVAGGQGAVTSKRTAEDLPSWMPKVEGGEESFQWRRVWIYDVASDSVKEVKNTESNIWEAVWCGHDAFAAVVSPGPGEGLWYTARLCVIDIHNGERRDLYTPQYQLGWPAASPSGKHVAVVEAICSDRGIVAGDVQLIDTASGSVRRLNTHGVDVTYTEWRSDHQLLLAGHRAFETVIGLYETGSGLFTDVWHSSEITGGGRYISVSGLNDSADCVFAAEGFALAPEIAVIRRGEYKAVKSFAPIGADPVSALAEVEQTTWRAPDGLEIHGWLLRPKVDGPHPLVMNVHGGPVWQWRPTWLGRGGTVLMLLRRGYAVLLPNPRGSTGRGQAFVQHVVGEMGGADTYDYLSGLDHLIERRIADPKRIGVTGGSYGGFMASWLITQDSRFAAAVPVAPVTNQVTEHLISNIPHFVSMFLADHYTNPGGKYFERSPVMHAHKVRTPTLNMCGALDRCTPPEEAVQFHNALLENNVTSVLVTYPEEGHGVRKLPAAIDYAARVVAWFETYMPSR